jgi:hypothetical protein
MAFLGVRKPRPTSLYHLLLRVFLRGPPTLWLRKMCGYRDALVSWLSRSWWVEE